MLLPINERMTAELHFLATLPSSAHATEFCRAALDALTTGAKRATFKHAAAALSADVDAVAGSIMAIAHVFVEAAKVRRGVGRRAGAPRWRQNADTQHTPALIVDLPLSSTSLTQTSSRRSATSLCPTSTSARSRIRTLPRRRAFARDSASRLPRARATRPMAPQL